MVVGKRLCLIILILSDVDSLFLGSLRSGAKYVHQKDSCQHTKLHLLHTLCSPDLRLLLLVNQSLETIFRCSLKIAFMNTVFCFQGITLAFVPYVGNTVYLFTVLLILNSITLIG